MSISALDVPRERLAVMADGSFGVLESKLAAALLRYRAPSCVCVIDRLNAGLDAADVVSVGAGVPVVEDLTQALEYRPTVLVLGIAPAGGELPEDWRPVIAEALSAGLHVMSGLHRFLSDDPELAMLAGDSGATIWDVRRPPVDLPVGAGRAKSIEAKRVLTVGSDCRTGKMVTALELERGALNRGWQAAFCATGQNGIMICGSGIAIDAVASDFISGAVEEVLVERAATGAKVLFIEGQGSLLHPSYSGVTLGLLHGAAPDAMILCHMPTRTRIARHGRPIPPLDVLVELYETAASWMDASPVVGIALNTFDLTEDEARSAVDKAADSTGLPTVDPVRFGVEALLDALEGRET